MIITSKSNELLTKIRKLQNDRDYRYETGLFVGEGRKLLGEAVMWKAEIDSVVYTEGCEQQDIPGAKAVTVTAPLMKSISLLTTPSEALFLCRMPKQAPGGKMSGVLVLDGIQDPGNLGTMIRTANALGIDRLILSEGCADPYNPKVVRSTMGAIFRQTIVHMTRQDIILAAREQGVCLTATALSDSAEDIRSVSLEASAVVIGSEGGGVSHELLDGADRCVIIPMQPCCESMNAAAAASIVMWEMKKNIL